MASLNESLFDVATSLKILLTCLNGTSLCYFVNSASIFYWINLLLRPINFTNSSYSGECLNKGTSFYLIGLSFYLSSLLWAFCWSLVAGTVPINKLGGLQFLKVCEYYWKSSWSSLLTSMCSNNSLMRVSSGKLSLARV